MNVTKYHGTGNDFFVLAAGADVPDRAAFARAVCDRETGISHPESPHRGADGVLFLELHPDEEPPRVGMTLIQPDGSTAAMCGNGARCAADWAVRRLHATDASAGDRGGGSYEVLVDTGAGPRRAAVGEDVTIEMGEPTFDPAAVPVESTEPFVERAVGGLTVTAVNTGVPHAVAFVEDVDAIDLDAVGPEVRHADAFPEGANLTVASSRGAPDGSGQRGFDQRTYERGVEGETRSCGTGAVAVAAVAVRLGLVERGRSVPVYPPGGRLDVTVSADGATLRGPVVREFTDELPHPAADAGGD